MEEAAHGLQNLLARIGAFFDIFDLSFFVSGAASVGALWFCYHKLGGNVLANLEGQYVVIGLILASYALGLVCFTLGRSLRQMILRVVYRRGGAGRFRRLIEAAVRAHGLGQVALGPKGERTAEQYLQQPNPAEGPDGPMQLYMLLWTKLRQSARLQPSLQLLNRYWVMAATYDGMAVAALVWAAVFFLWWRGLVLPVPPTPLCGVGVLVCIGLCWLYLREAERYTRVQIGELVATMAWDHIAEAPSAEAAPLPAGVNIQVTHPPHGS